MPDFYTCFILLINQSEEIGEKQLSVFGSRGGQISPLMHVALLTIFPPVRTLVVYSIVWFIFLCSLYCKQYELKSDLGAV